METVALSEMMTNSRTSRLLQSENIAAVNVKWVVKAGDGTVRMPLEDPAVIQLTSTPCTCSMVFRQRATWSR